MGNQIIQLRFPDNPTTKEGLAVRQRMCRAAQRAADLGHDIKVPHGVEVIAVPK